jgi:hypothetical protein
MWLDQEQRETSSFITDASVANPHHGGFFLKGAAM